MDETPRRADHRLISGSLRRRSGRAIEDSARIAARTEEALRRLHAAMPPEAAASAPRDSAPEKIDPTPSTQMRRGHIVIVNNDPAFLDAARVILQAGLYNVTTTNLVPLTYQLIDAAGADALVIDLTIEEPAIWALVEQLRAGQRTRRMPIVFTSTDDALLERAARRPWPAGGRFVFHKPMRPDDLTDAIHALVGPA